VRCIPYSRHALGLFTNAVENGLKGQFRIGSRHRQTAGEQRNFQVLLDVNGRCYEPCIESTPLCRIESTCPMRSYPFARLTGDEFPNFLLIRVH
jgi:hypothetical protein